MGRIVWLSVSVCALNYLKMELNVRFLVLIGFFAGSVNAGCDRSIAMKELNADVIIGGLFPVHYYSSYTRTYTLNTYAMTWIEAFFHSVDQVNKDPLLLPGVKIGFDVRDSCNDERFALRHALDFTLDRSYFGHSRKSDNILSCQCAHNVSSRLVAVVGGASSSVSIAISHLLGVQYIPQVSYSSSSVILSDKSRYRNFLRTMPSDIHQAKAIADFVNFFNWTFVNLLASDDDYGRLGSDELRKELVNRHVCRAVDRTFPANITTSDARDIVLEIKKYLGKANVIILWCQIGSAKTILAEARNMGLLGATWIGTESWGNNVDLFTLDHDIINGIIGIKPTVFTVGSFEKHLQSIYANHTNHNPWLIAHWNEVFKCESKNNTKIINQDLYKWQDLAKNVVDVKCLDGLPAKRLLPLNKYPNVMSAVYAIAHGLHEALECNSTTCSKSLKDLKPNKLLPTIKETSFRLPGSNMKVTFDEHGDLKYASYTFTNLVVSDKDEHHNFVEIGSWSDEDQNFNLSVKNINWPSGPNVPKSQCSSPCQPGQYKIGGRQPCCWECASCQPDHVSSSSSQDVCTPCPHLTISTSNRTYCIPLTKTTWDFNSLTGVLMMSLIGVGLVLTTFTGFIFLKYRNTPVVKSSNRELTMLQIICLFLLSWIPLGFFFDETKASCVVRVISFAVLHTIVVSVVFTKTYRLSLIFRKMTTKESKLLNNSYQSLLVFGLVCLQLIILGAWHIFYTPKIVYEINRREKTVVLHCGWGYEILGFLMTGLIFILMFCSAYIAFRARKLPEGFNEARFISFAMFINAIIWFSYIPVYFSLPRLKRSVLYSIVNSFSTLTILILLYGNKIKVMLFQPELNTAAQYRQKAAHSTIMSVLKDGAHHSAISLPSLQGGISGSPNIIATPRLSPALNRRYGTKEINAFFRSSNSCSSTKSLVTF